MITKVYNEHNNTSFHIDNIYFKCDYISSSPTYGVIISQLVMLELAESMRSLFYHDRLYTKRLLELGYNAAVLNSGLHNIWSRHLKLMDRNYVSVCTMTNNLFLVSYISFVLLFPCTWYFKSYSMELCNISILQFLSHNI